MVAHSLIEDFLSGVVREHPTSYLGVPHQAVATKPDAILTTEIGNTVGSFPVELSLAGLSGFGFHVVLCSHAAEFLEYQSLLGRVSDITLIHGYTYEEIILVDILQALGLGGETYLKK